MVRHKKRVRRRLEIIRDLLPSEQLQTQSSDPEVSAPSLNVCPVTFNGRAVGKSFNHFAIPFLSSKCTVSICIRALLGGLNEVI